MKLRKGFTLLEVMLAITILSMMGIMVFGSFQSLVDTTTRAEKAMDRLHLQESIMNQIEDALKAAIYASDNPEIYEFLYEEGTGSPPDDLFSWVTSSSAFLPADSPLHNSIIRLELSIQDVDGETGLAARAYSSMLDPESNEAEDVEPWLISQQVIGMKLHFYDPGDQDWEEEWDRNNQLPVTLALTLTFKPENTGEKALTRTRQIDIPVGRLSRETGRGRRRSEDAAE